MTTILQAEHCSRTFKGLVAVKQFSAKLEEGNIYGLIGTNGAGKTTVINMLSGVLAPTSGKIVYKGTDITDWKPDRVAKAGILRTYQNLRLFNKMTVLENVVIGAQMHRGYSFADGLFHTKRYSEHERKYREKAMAMLREVHLDSCADVQAASLPYGSQRRLEIARILAADPQLILLDEPAAGMNPQESAELVQMIRHVQETYHLTVLLIEHDMKVIMNLCSYIYAMAQGEVIAEGTPEQIRSDPKVITAYLGRRAHV